MKDALHVPMAQASLRASKHVLVQKPLATTGADARATVELAAAVGRVLFVDYSYRLLQTADVMRTALPEVGTIQGATAAFHNKYGPGAGREWFVDPNRSGGGAGIDLGVHMLDMLLWLLEPREARLEQAVLNRRPGWASNTVRIWSFGWTTCRSR